MEKETELLFALSNDDRRRLLMSLKVENMRLTQLAQKLSASVQETSQHLARLNDAKLVEKATDGSYKLTPYGEQALGLLPSFSFLSENRDYFLSHDLSFLPRGFLQRIGDLADNRFVTHVSEMIDRVQRMATDAEQYGWFMVDRPPTYNFTLKHEVRNTLRALVTSIQPEAVQLGRSLFGERFELRFLEKVRMSISMNEKTAGVCFPRLDGRIDFNYGFVSESPNFHSWCHDLFSVFWGQSRRSPSAPASNS